MYICVCECVPTWYSLFHWPPFVSRKHLQFKVNLTHDQIPQRGSRVGSLALFFGRKKRADLMCASGFALHDLHSVFFMVGKCEFFLTKTRVFEFILMWLFTVFLGMTNGDYLRFIIIVYKKHINHRYTKIFPLWNVYCRSWDIYIHNKSSFFAHSVLAFAVNSCVIKTITHLSCLI